MNTQLILDVVAEREAQHVARRNAIEAAFRETNSDIPPIVDRLGRLHAPVDGYMMPDGWESNNDKIYGKGQWIPMPRDPDADYFFCGKFDLQHRAKVMGTVTSITELINFVKSNNVPAEVGMGKSWEKDGQQVAYAYIKAQWKTLVAAIESCLTVVTATEVKPEPEVYVNGKATMTGKIVSIKVQESYFGPMVKMMVVTEQGHKLYGSLPSSLSDAERGDVVTFTATFEAGERGMSWFKRPSKAVFVSRAA